MEIQDSTTKCLELFREKIKEESGLQRFKTILTDDFLLHFIHGRKERVDYAMETLLQYFYVRHIKYRDFFLDTLPSKLTLKDYIFGKPLLQKGPEGQTIFISRREWWPSLESSKQNGYTWDNILQKFIVLAEEMWNLPGVDVNGFEIVMDCSTLTFADIIWLLRVSYAIKLISLFHKAFPIRAKKIHLINPPMYVNLVINLIRPVDPAGLLNKVHSHYGKLSSLHEQLPVDILPKFLKGSVEDDKAFDEDFQAKAVKNDESFLKLHKALTRRNRRKQSVLNLVK